jgi:hypothetical protein
MEKPPRVGVVEICRGSRMTKLPIIMGVRPKPKPEKTSVKRRNKSQNRRKILEKQIEEMVKLIVCWRDGATCVMNGFGGCGNGLMWNHFIAQGQSHWLKFDLGNVHWGCGNHNLLDYRGSKVFAIWFSETFGHQAMFAMEIERQSHTGANGKRSIPELEAMLERYDELYQNRYMHGSDDLHEEVKGGYYGDVIRTAWIKEGRLPVEKV